MFFNGVFGHSYRNAEKDIENLISHISETMLYKTSMDTCICLQQKKQKISKPHLQLFKNK